MSQLKLTWVPTEASSILAHLFWQFLVKLFCSQWVVNLPLGIKIASGAFSVHKMHHVFRNGFGSRYWSLESRYLTPE